ncbi:MAG: YibE/F family protein, partial [Patescibacteria group bacterium]
MHNHVGENHLDRKPNKYIVIVILAISILGLFLVAPKSLNKDIFKGKVTQIKEERIEDSVAGMKIKVQELFVAVNISKEQKEFSVVNDFTPVKVGDKVFMKSSLFGDDQSFEIIDLSREKGIIILTALFIFLVIITAGWKGFYSLIGLIFSLAVIIAFIVPMILKGYNPVTVGITGSILILLGTLYLSYGLHKKSISALIGITATLLFVGLLSNFTVQILRFTGFANEGALFLNMEAGNPINVVGL